MSLIKKHLKGWKTPRLCCPKSACRVRQKPEQLDFFGLDNYFYREGRFFYELQEKEDVSKCKPEEF